MTEEERGTEKEIELTSYLNKCFANSNKKANHLTTEADQLNYGDIEILTNGKRTSTIELKSLSWLHYSQCEADNNPFREKLYVRPCAFIEMYCRKPTKEGEIITQSWFPTSKCKYFSFTDINIYNTASESGKFYLFKLNSNVASLIMTGRNISSTGRDPKHIAFGIKIPFEDLIGYCGFGIVDSNGWRELPRDQMFLEFENEFTKNFH